MHKKIKIWDLIRNRDGKLSGSGTAGFFICTAGILAFLGAVVGWYFSLDGFDIILEKTILFTGIGATLLGVRKLKKEDAEGGTENDK